MKNFRVGLKRRNRKYQDQATVVRPSGFWSSIQSYMAVTTKIGGPPAQTPGRRLYLLFHKVNHSVWQESYAKTGRLPGLGSIEHLF